MKTKTKLYTTHTHTHTSPRRKKSSTTPRLSCECLPSRDWIVVVAVVWLLTWNFSTLCTRIQRDKDRDREKERMRAQHCHLFAFCIHTIMKWICMHMWMAVSYELEWPHAEMLGDAGIIDKNNIVNSRHRRNGAHFHLNGKERAERQQSHSDRNGEHNEFTWNISYLCIKLTRKH